MGVSPYSGIDYGYPGHPGIVETGRMQGWYFAECQNCIPIRPAPFRVEVIRDRLAEFHEKHTGHYVVSWAELLLEL